VFGFSAPLWAQEDGRDGVGDIAPRLELTPEEWEYFDNMGASQAAPAAAPTSVTAPRLELTPEEWEYFDKMGASQEPAAVIAFTTTTTVVPSTKWYDYVIHPYDNLIKPAVSGIADGACWLWRGREESSYPGGGLQSVLKPTAGFVGDVVGALPKAFNDNVLGSKGLDSRLTGSDYAVMPLKGLVNLGGYIWDGKDNPATGEGSGGIKYVLDNPGTSAKYAGAAITAPVWAPAYGLYQLGDYLYDGKDNPKTGKGDTGIKGLADYIWDGKDNPETGKGTGGLQYLLIGEDDPNTTGWSERGGLQEVVKIPANALAVPILKGINDQIAEGTGFDVYQYFGGKKETGKDSAKEPAVPAAVPTSVTAPRLELTPEEWEFFDNMGASQAAPAAAPTSVTAPRLELTPEEWEFFDNMGASQAAPAAAPTSVTAPRLELTPEEWEYFDNMGASQAAPAAAASVPKVDTRVRPENNPGVASYSSAANLAGYLIKQNPRAVEKNAPITIGNVGGKVHFESLLMGISKSIGPNPKGQEQKQIKGIARDILVGGTVKGQDLQKLYEYLRAQERALSSN
jgi:hypothetical protein